MPTLDRTLALVLGNLALFRRDPGPLISRIAQPVLLLLLLQPLYSLAMDDPAAGVRQLVLGHLILFSLLGMSIVGTAILNERRWRTFDRLRATPALALELLAGKAVPILLFILAQQAVVLGLGIAVLDLRVASYPLLALADVVWALTVLCLGAAVAVLVRSFAQLSAVVDIGASIAVGLGGGLVPRAAMPQWAQATAPVWPAYWAMESLRNAVIGNPTAVLTNCAVLGGVATLATAVAGIRLARGWGRETLL
jgi:ABC-2 type transport system permease protein